jgi:membrane dipeptidase
MLVDLHEDIAHYFMMSSSTVKTEPFDKDVKGRQSDIPKLRRGSVSIVFGSIFPMLGNLNISEIEKSVKEYGVWSTSYIPASSRDLAIEQIKIYNSLEKLYPKYIKILRKKQDIDQLGTKIGIILHLEGCEPLYEPEDIKLFYELGVRSIGITWNFDNRYGSSCLSKVDYGLTGSGEDLIRIANKLSIMVDLSHSGEKTCKDTLKLSKKPPFFSHSNSKRVHKARRNISDSLIEMVGRQGGIVGLTLIRSCIGEPANSSKLAEHIFWVLKVGGENVPAIGTDMLGISNTPDDIHDISEINVLRKTLLKAGLNEDRVEKVFCRNALSYIEKYSESWD